VKINVFATNNTHDTEEFMGREAGGNRTVSLQDTETDLVQKIDEHQMSDKKLTATRFLTFLGNRRLTMEMLKDLSKEEQTRLRKEFWENN
jgi:hypothetical protein